MYVWQLTIPDLFGFKLISVTHVHNTLNDIDNKETAGPDNLDPYHFRMAADIIVKPILHHFNCKSLNKHNSYNLESTYIPHTVSI